MTLRLRIRTPAGLLLDRAVDAVVAEDRDGWFGVLPRRADLVATLPPGLLTFRHADGEGFVAHAGGLLDLRAGDCRVALRGAQLSDALDDVADRLEAELRRRKERVEVRRGILGELEREVLRRLVAGERREAG